MKQIARLKWLASPKAVVNLGVCASICASLCSLLSSCSAKQKFDGHGLRAIEIRVKEDLVDEVWSGAMRKIDIPGHVWIDGQKHAMRLEAAGATSIRASKKSWDLKFQDDAGIQWQGQGQSQGKRAREVRLSSMVADPTFLRSLLALEVFRAAGSMTSSAEPVFLHLNDRKLGLYILVEKIDEDFLLNRALELRRIFIAQGGADFSPSMATQIEQFYSTKPKPSQLEMILALGRTLSITDDAAFETEVFRYLDRSATISYLAGARVTNHWDGFNKNLHLIQTKDSPLLRPLPWDLDQAWRTDLSNATDPWALNLLFSRVASLPSVRAEWSAKVVTLLAGEAAPAALRARAEFWKARISEAYAVDPVLGLQGRSLDSETEQLLGEIAAWIEQIK